MTHALDPARRLAELRRAFDQSFAEPARPPETDSEDFLGMRVGEDACAVRVVQLTGLVASSRIVPLPATAPGFLGLAGVRGNLVPIYGLRELLGYPPSEAPPRWFLLAGTGDPIGLAFDELDGYLRVRRSDRAPRAPEPSASAHLREVVRTGELVRAVLDITSLIQTIKARVRPGGPSKE